MIISHRLKVIYIKLSKVASTSFEIALSKYCGTDDIIIPFKKKAEENMRKSLGFYGGQNNEEFGTQEHLCADQIKEHVSADIWNNYLKIATIRCPYDTYISSYYFNMLERKKKKILFEKFVANTKGLLSSLYRLHGKDGKLLTDFLIRYEHLDEDIKELEIKINCPGLLETFQSIGAKKNLRPKIGASSCEMYSKYPNAKLIIDERCRDAANKHKYEFFREYWPRYKTKLEKAMEDYSASHT